MKTIRFGVARLADGSLVAGAITPEYPGYVCAIDEDFLSSLAEGCDGHAGVFFDDLAQFNVTALDSVAEARAIGRHVAGRDSEMLFCIDIQQDVVLLTEIPTKGDPLQGPESWVLEDQRIGYGSMKDLLDTESGEIFRDGDERIAALGFFAKGLLKPGPVYQGTLGDWRGHEIEEGDVPAQSLPVCVVAENDKVSIHLGGSLDDPYAPQASTVSVERDGTVTRVLLNDSLCDAPMIFEIPDGQPIEVKPSDWEPVTPSDEPGL